MSQDLFTLDRPCPFCGGTVIVRHYDANIGARGTDFIHVHVPCERWQSARCELDKTEDGKALREACLRWASEADEYEVSMVHPFLRRRQQP